jgi:CBS domain-containing protein
VARELRPRETGAQALRVAGAPPSHAGAAQILHPGRDVSRAEEDCMSIERFTRKQVVAARADEPASAVAAHMRDRHVGAVVVMEGERPVGIVTDRDLALRVLAAGLPPATPVRQVMSTPLVTVRVDESLDAVVLRMREKGVRRMPIVGVDGTPVGMVTLDDVSVLLAGEISTTAGAILDNRGP